MSLFVVPNRSAREQVLEIVGHDAVIWSENDNAYVVVGRIRGRSRSGQVVEYVRRYTD